VWEVNASHGIYRRDGNAWTHVAGPALKYVSVASDGFGLGGIQPGAVWGLDSAGNIQVWNATLNAWQPLPFSNAGKFSDVSVKDRDHAWGVDAADHIHFLANDPA
jgi:hypothetical protein